MTRRMLIFAGAAVLLRAAKPKMTRARVSAITDELAATQAEAVAFAREAGLGGVELRNVPESGKPFASLSDPELKRWATMLEANKLKVSALHVPADTDAATAMRLLSPAMLINGANADALWTPEADWESAWKKLPRQRILSVRVAARTLDRQGGAHLPWKPILEMLNKDGYAGNFVVVAGTPPSEANREAVRELVHLIGQI